MQKLCSTLIVITFFFAALALADSTSAGQVDVSLQIPLPGPAGTVSSIPVCKPFGKILSCTGIAEYIAIIYRWLVGFAAVLAVVAMTWGGVQWLTSAGESGKIQEARKVIGNAIIGLVLALGSYLLLAAINPRLVQYDAISVQRLDPLDLKIEELIDTHNAVRGRFNTSPGIAVSGFTKVTFDADSKKDVETSGVLTQILVDLLKDIEAQGFNVKVSTLSSGHKPGSFHNPRGRAADIVGTQGELSRLASYLKTSQARLQVNELYYAFNPDAAVEECVPQNSSYLNAPKRARLKKDHEDHVHVAVGCGSGSFPKAP